jgi:hypothetical protein
MVCDVERKPIQLELTVNQLLRAFLPVTIPPKAPSPIGSPTARNGLRATSKRISGSGDIVEVAIADCRFAYTIKGESRDEAMECSGAGTSAHLPAPYKVCYQD